MFLTMADILAAATQSHLEEFMEMPSEDIATILSHSIMSSVMGGRVDQEQILNIAYDTLTPFFVVSLGGVNPLPIVRMTTDYPIKQLIELVCNINQLYIIADYKVILNFIICEVMPRNG